MVEEKDIQDVEFSPSTRKLLVRLRDTLSRYER